jgi:FO synthase
MSIVRSLEHKPLENHEALALAEIKDWRALAGRAAQLRDAGWGRRITYSRKVFVPLTQLCRDVCHYCTFAKTPSRLGQPYLSADEALEIVSRGAEAGCKEVLFTLGDKPELRYKRARQALDSMGFATTLAYLEHVAGRVLKETGLLPHLNPGLLEPEDFARLRKVAPSMGLMLESSSPRLAARGGPHFGSPDKVPARRLATLRTAGIMRVPMTSGILIGIGETRAERIEALLALREIDREYGQIQEIIVQNFRAKPDTKMHAAAEPDMDELCWTIAAARLIVGSAMSIQAPPNLYTGDLVDLVRAGINDWGGVSPVTPDHVNPEAPWPHLDVLNDQTERAGFNLVERLTVYPRYIESRDEWIAPEVSGAVLRLSDGAGLARVGRWSPGSTVAADAEDLRETAHQAGHRDAGQRPSAVTAILERLEQREDVAEHEIAELFTARGTDFTALLARADTVRERAVGKTVSFAVVRNINYTNICLYKCGFCAFSKGKTHEALRGAPYMLDRQELERRVREAWDRGATEVCMQGGIHPSFSGQTYLDILRAAKAAVPAIHVHAFSPLEVWHGAHTLKVSLREYLQELKHAGLGSMPGTAAEILDDEVRRQIAPDKVTTDQWLEVVRAAHDSGLRTTATIMFGHVEGYVHWARHMLRLRSLQRETGGFTEFVPLPFVHMEAPLYLRGRARKGPTLREAILMHAVARLVFDAVIPNIQASWTKLGPTWAQRCLSAGVNDLGGTLMNESISRAAGAAHGQELPPQQMEELIRAAGREPMQRTTLYQAIDAERQWQSRHAAPLAECRSTAISGRSVSFA